MAHFTNQFDKIATELGCSVIYCHHHSKGTQGGKKSMDRASGSGVFARDPDALIDLVELEMTESIMKQQIDQAAANVYAKAIKAKDFDYFDERVSQDDLQSAFQMNEHAARLFSPLELQQVEHEINQAVNAARIRTAWRVDGTLREYPKFEPVNMWFQYPVHRVDDTGILKDIEPEGNLPPWKNAMTKRKDPEEKKAERAEAFDTAFEALDDGENPVTVDEVAEYLGIDKRTVWRRIKEHGGYETEKGDDKRSIITKK